MAQQAPPFRGRFVLPIARPAGKSPDAFLRECFENNERGAGGWYPVGENQTWHNGIHLAAGPGTAVHCVAAGRIVAARVLLDPPSGAHAFGSPCFVLVRHDIDVVKQLGLKWEVGIERQNIRQIELFTLYMHLDRARTTTTPVPWLNSFLPFLEDSALQVGPDVWRIDVKEDAPAGGAEKTGLNVRTEPTKNGAKITPGSVIACVPKGTVLERLSRRIGDWQEVRVPTEGIPSGWLLDRGSRIARLPAFPAQLADLRAGRCARLDVSVAKGEAVGNVGLIRPRGTGTAPIHGIHLETFSAENVIASAERGDWTVLDDDTDDDALCEFETLAARAASNSWVRNALEHLGWDASHWLTKEEIKTYFDGLGEEGRKALRACITYNTSFWAVDWNRMVDKNPEWAAQFSFDQAARDAANMYSWWKECEQKQVPLPPRTRGKALAFHYHPLSLLAYLDARWAPRWVLGTLSAAEESNGNPGTISSGVGDPGGVSYGTYQLATNRGRPQEFVAFLKDPYPEFYDELVGKTPATPEFNQAWTALATDHRDEFAQAQHEFIYASHYKKALERIEANHPGFDLRARSRTLNDVLWSTAVQHGDTGAPKVFSNAFDTIDPDPVDAGDAEVIEAVYAERGRKNADGKLVWFPNVADSWITQLTNRFTREKNAALAALRAETGQ